MIFLIEYDRDRGKLVTFSEFPDIKRAEAHDARLKIEINLNGRGIDHEVVLLEAADVAALHKTHRRYFETLEQLASTPGLY